MDTPAVVSAPGRCPSKALSVAAAVVRRRRDSIQDAWRLFLIPPPNSPSLVVVLKGWSDMPPTMVPLLGNLDTLMKKKTGKEISVTRKILIQFGLKNHQ